MMKSFQQTLGRNMLPSSRTVMGAQDQPIRFLPVLAAVATVAVAYAALFGIYRPWNIDNSWFLSFSYDLCVKGIEGDIVFGGEFPAGIGHPGMGGTVAFGKIAAYYQCLFLVPFGWTLTAAYLLSLITTLAALGLVYLLLRGVGYSVKSTLFFCIALMLFEPFVALANQVKYEYITFALSVGALLLHRRNWLFLSAFVAVLAFEAQPIGIMALAYVGSSELDRWLHEGLSGLPRRLVHLAAGTVAGLAVFVALHPDFLSNLIALAQTTGEGRSHFLYPYFFAAKFYRHLPELVVFAAVFVIQVIRWRSLTWHFPIIASVLTFIAGLIIGHNNYHYTPFWYFPALLMVFECFTWRFQPALFFLATAVYTLPQYVYVVYANNQYRDQAYLQQVRDIVDAHRRPDASAVIYGHYLFWHPFMDRDFYWDGQFGVRPIHTADQLFLTCLVGKKPEEEMYPDCSEDLRHVGPAARIGSAEYGPYRFEVYLIEDAARLRAPARSLGDGTAIIRSTADAVPARRTG